MPGKIELIISADAANAIKTVKATQAQINNLAKQLPKLEAEFSKTRDSADLDKVNKQMSEMSGLRSKQASPQLVNSIMRHSLLFFFQKLLEAFVSGKTERVFAF